MSSLGAIPAIASLIGGMLLAGVEGAGTQPEKVSPQEEAVRLTASAVEAFERGKAGDAERDLRLAISRSPSTYEAHFWLGRVLAQRAGSSPAARSEAVAEFRRALELQPFGEEGDLARDWLLHIGGRPTRVLLVEGEDPAAKSRDRGASRAVIAEVGAQAAKNGFDVLDRSRRDQSIAVVSPSQVTELVRRCQSDTGVMEAGWLAAISVDELNIVRGKASYTATGSARLWLVDPIAKRVHPPIEVRPNSFNLLSVLFSARSSSQEVYQQAVRNMAAAVCRKIRGMTTLTAGPALLDETMFPLQVDGVYGRASAAYVKAVSLPRILVIQSSPVPPDDERAEISKRVLTTVQRGLMEGGALSVISPGNAARAAEALGVKVNADGGPKEWVPVARRLGSKYLTQLELETLETRVGGSFIKKITADAGLRLTVIDAETGNVVLAKLYSARKSSTRLLPNEVTTTALRCQSDALDEAGVKVLADLKGLML